MAEAGDNGAPPSALDRRRSAGARIENYPAYVSLCCGLASLVPWVIVLTFPLALVFGVAGLVKSLRLRSGQGRKAALLGMAVAVAAALLHLALVGAGALIGFL
jgi:hypothetical protein